MKYYVISALINIGVLLIPITTPVFKEKFSEKEKRQVIVVDLKNSVLEKNRTGSTIDTDNNEEGNGTAGLSRETVQQQTSSTDNFDSQKSQTPAQAKSPRENATQPRQTPQPFPISPPKNETPKTESRPVITQNSPTAKSGQAVTPPAAANTPKQPQTASSTSGSNSTVSQNSGNKDGGSSNSGSFSGNSGSGNINGSRNGRGTGTGGNSTSSGNGSDRQSGSTRGGGCREGTDFSVSYNGNLKMPPAAQRLGRSVVVMVTVRFTRSGSVSIVSATGGNGALQAQAKIAAGGIHVNFKTNNCSSGTVTKPFRFN